jgi:hypothetical protein
METNPESLIRNAGRRIAKIFRIGNAPDPKGILPSAMLTAIKP